MKHAASKPSETTDAAALAILNALSGMVQCHSPEETAESLIALIRNEHASHNDKARFVMSLLIVAQQAANAFAEDAKMGVIPASKGKDPRDAEALEEAADMLADVSKKSNKLADRIFQLSDVIPHTVR